MEEQIPLEHEEDWWPSRVHISEQLQTWDLCSPSLLFIPIGNGLCYALTTLWRPPTNTNKDPNFGNNIVTKDLTPIIWILNDVSSKRGRWHRIVNIRNVDWGVVCIFVTNWYVRESFEWCLYSDIDNMGETPANRSATYYKFACHLPSPMLILLKCCHWASQLHLRFQTFKHRIVVRCIVECKLSELWLIL